MVKGIIENTHIISSKVTKFIWLIDYNNFSKINMYFKTKRVFFSITLTHLKVISSSRYHPRGGKCGIVMWLVVLLCLFF